MGNLSYNCSCNFLQIYREKKLQEYNELVAECTLRHRLQDALKARQQLDKPWKNDDERDYQKLCKEFDALTS